MDIQKITLEKYIPYNSYENNLLYLNTHTNSIVLLKIYDLSSKLLVTKLKKLGDDKINFPTIELILNKDEKLYVLQEYISGMTLTDYINKNKIDTLKIKYILNTLIAIIQILHDEDIIHRDIKPDNIIIDLSNNIYLIDYDISRVYDKQKTYDTTKFGTEHFAPPEQFGFSQTNYKSDIYALGMTLKVIVNEKNTDFIIDNLITNMTHFDPNKRLNLDQIKYYLNHSQKYKFQILPFYIKKSFIKTVVCNLLLLIFSYAITDVLYESMTEENILLNYDNYLVWLIFTAILIKYTLDYMLTLKFIHNIKSKVIKWSVLYFIVAFPVVILLEIFVYLSFLF